MNLFSNYSRTDPLNHCLIKVHPTAMLADRLVCRSYSLPDSQVVSDLFLPLLDCLVLLSMHNLVALAKSSNAAIYVRVDLATHRLLMFDVIDLRLYWNEKK